MNKITELKFKLYWKGLNDGRVDSCGYYHPKFQMTLTVHDNNRRMQIRFSFFNVADGYIIKPDDVSGILECIFSDALLYATSSNIDEFWRELGRDMGFSETKRAWDGCKRMYNRLGNLMSTFNLEKNPMKADVYMFLSDFLHEVLYEENFELIILSERKSKEETNGVITFKFVEKK